ncbi:MAG: formylglycine-generating enzyme family protein, partial [Candidatus Methylophosphatis roskildensis]
SQIQRLAGDERFASVVVSCREKDFVADFSLPFDTLSLQPLTPTQIRSFLHRALSLHLGPDQGPGEAEARFWRIAGGEDGEDLRQVWQAWERAGADFELFWSAEGIPSENSDVSSATSWKQNALWRRVRFDPRGLIRLAANPYLLIDVMTALPAIPANRAQLFEGFLEVLFERERAAREKRHDAARIPDRGAWEAALVELAETLQRAGGAQEADGARTALSQADWPQSLNPAIIDFSVDASVLQVKGNDIRFTHQLLQEYLASRLLLAASRSAARPAADFWPAATWWQRSGWEVVAEIAGESCGADLDAQAGLIAWLAEANPEAACEVWRRLGEPALSHAILARIAERWLARMTDVGRESHPYARAAIGRALGRFGLDPRPGVGLRADGLPAIDWVEIPSAAFIYQSREHPALPTFHLARYPVTNAQFQAFIDAGGYREDAWWTGLAQRFDAPAQPDWDEPNAPRETVSWYEAVAFCHWLGDRLGYPISLPTEQLWERAARGTQGFEYPWGEGYRGGYANCNETWDETGAYDVGRTTAVGIYPQAGSPEGVLDLAGNVWEWCLNEYGSPKNTSLLGDVSRVLRGGSWLDVPRYCRAASRYYYAPDYRSRYIGFRVCCSSPIE